MKFDVLKSRLLKTGFTRREEIDQEGWMVSYADLITLLFIFFSFLLSISVISRTKFEMISGEFNHEEPSNLAEIKKQLDGEIARQGLDGKVRTSMNDEGLQVQFSEEVLFPSAEATLNAGGIKMLKGFTGLLGRVDKNYHLAIEGHTDDLPIHTEKYPSNWTLSAARAVQVLHFLAENGVNEKKMMVRAYGDTRPIAKPSASPIDVRRAMNRRVDLLIY